MNSLLTDLRVALRGLRRTPGFAVAAIATLSLGIGASTAVFAALERVVLDPLPYPAAERLVRLRSAVPGVALGTEWDVSMGAWFFFGAEAPSLETLGAYRRGGATLGGPSGPERVRTASVTAGALRIFGARPAIGRIIGEADDDPGSTDVAVLSHGFWERRFGGDPEIVGRTVTVDERPYEVIGVMAPGVELPPAGGVPADRLKSDFWLPLRLNPAGPFWNSHAEFRTVARLADGATIDAAQDDLDRLTARLPEAVPNAYSPEFMERYGFATRVYDLRAYVVGEASDSLWILFGATGLLLAIAFANVANLMLVRAEGRRREIAIRQALGARTRALWGQLVAYSLVLVVPGGVGGWLLAAWGTEWLAALAPEGVPRLDGVRLDGSSALFAVSLTLFAAAVLTVLPALRVARNVRSGDLSGGGRGATAPRQRQRARSGLVIAQVALALMLIVGAGLLVESFRRLRAVDPGIQPDRVVTLRVHLPYARYDDVPTMWRFYDAVLTRVEALAGVRVAGFTTSLPFDGGFGCTIQGFEDPAVSRRVAESGGTLCAGQELATPNYLAAMGIPVLRGRGLTQADFDDPTRGSVMVSRAFAERFWPGQDPIGKGVGPSGRTNQQYYRVVGVVGDVYAGSVADPPATAIYYPVHRIPETTGIWPNPLTLVVAATVAQPTSLVPAIRTAVQQVDPAIPVSDVREMRTVMQRSAALLSFMMALIGIAASVALLLAGVGLHAVVAYVVTRRTNEIGIRMALGGRPRHVVGLVVGGSLRLALAGVGIGAAAAVAATRVLRGVLYDVQSTNLSTYAAAALVLGGVAAVAAWVPARRATRVDPVEALRHE